MPELPEVYTITKQLNKVLPGKVIESVEVLREKSFGGEEGELRGKRVAGVERKGKVMAVKLQAPSSKLQEPNFLLIHLKMTGQLIYQATRAIQTTQAVRVVGGHPTADWVGELPSKHTRVVIGFTDGSTLFFNDQRVFGWMRLVDRVQWLGYRDSLPPDIIDPEFTAEYLYSVLQRSRRPVKLVVMDSSRIGGAGNIYANDALYISRINPNTPANQVKFDAVKRLHQALVQVINRGIATGGASIKDYVDAGGQGGGYQNEFAVYSKEGEPCPTCGSEIVKIMLGGRGTYFCPVCQRE